MARASTSQTYQVYDTDTRQAISRTRLSRVLAWSTTLAIALNLFLPAASVPLAAAQTVMPSSTSMTGQPVTAPTVSATISPSASATTTSASTASTSSSVASPSAQPSTPAAAASPTATVAPTTASNPPVTGSNIADAQAAQPAGPPTSAP